MMRIRFAVTSMLLVVGLCGAAEAATLFPGNFVGENEDKKAAEVSVVEHGLLPIMAISTEAPASMQLNMDQVSDFPFYEERSTELPAIEVEYGLALFSLAIAGYVVSVRTDS